MRGRLATLPPLRPQRALTVEIAARLEDAIVSGRLLPGQQLPTEARLMAETGVSRTVVREAVAALRAKGLVTTRQGAGAFVTDILPTSGFVVDPALSRSIDAAVGVLELRRAVEVEAAGLAAERASKAGLRAIAAAHTAFERAVRKGASAAEEDLGFHLAIAKATGNGHFLDFLQYLGHHVIPRQRFRTDGAAIVHGRTYLQRVAAEHAVIASAIIARNKAAAKTAMEQHLSRAIKRYKALRTGTDDPA